MGNWLFTPDVGGEINKVIHDPMPSRAFAARQHRLSDALPRIWIERHSRSMKLLSMKTPRPSIESRCLQASSLPVKTRW